MKSIEPVRTGKVIRTTNHPVPINMTVKPVKVEVEADVPEEVITVVKKAKATKKKSDS